MSSTWRMTASYASLRGEAIPACFRRFEDGSFQEIELGVEMHPEHRRLFWPCHDKEKPARRCTSAS
jgi:hypothetical protein